MNSAKSRTLSTNGIVAREAPTACEMVVRHLSRLYLQESRVFLQAPMIEMGFRLASRDLSI